MTTMFAFEEMFKPHIKNSRLKMPEDFSHYDIHEYPHFAVFMYIHLDKAIDITELENNANIIADIPDTDIKFVTIEDLIAKGLEFGHGDII